MSNETSQATKKSLFARFLPYLMRYRGILFFDLFCAALTTLCDIVLPKIMSYLTNAATDTAVALTAGVVLKLAALYLILRLIDGAANYYMSSTGHIMGVYIETDMRRDAFAHLQRLSDTYYSNTKVGQIMGRITNDLFDVTEFAHHCPEEFFIAAIKIVVSFVILCRASVPLTLAVKFSVTVTVRSSMVAPVISTFLQKSLPSARPELLLPHVLSPGTTTQETGIYTVSSYWPERIQRWSLLVASAVIRWLLPSLSEMRLGVVFPLLNR